MLDSIKFGLSLWLLTYIGSWFNAMTLIILSWVGLFTIPKVIKFNHVVEKFETLAMGAFMAKQCLIQKNLLGKHELFTNNT
jgi:hypothetical protein